MKKKILIFDNALAPYRIDLFNALSEHFEANIYFFRKNMRYDKFDMKKMESQLNFKPKFLTFGLEHPYKDRMLRFGFVNKIIKHKPDLIICLEFNIMTFITAVFAKIFFPKTKVYSLCDDSEDVAKNSPAFRRIGRSLCCKFLDGIILCNEPAEKWYNRKFPNVKTIVSPIIQKEERIVSIINNAQHISTGYIKKYKLQDKNILLFVGRLTKVKNLIFLLEVFSQHVSTNKNGILILVGDGDKKEELIRLVENLKIQENVIFAGRYEHDALYAWYPVADYFILPSTCEPFGAVVNESLIAGVPVLCSDLAGASCMINEKNGRTINPYDKEKLLSVMNEVLIKTKDARADFIQPGSLMPYTFNKKIKELISFLNNEEKV